jgi:hypothetical protein
MKKPALLLALAVLLPAGTARADFVQDVGSPLPVATDPYSVATADFDGNGRPDIATASATAGKVTVYRRGVAGGFAPEAPDLDAPGASDLVAADLNGDGRQDLAVAGSGVYVFTRKSDRTGFNAPGPVLTGPQAVSITAADLNADRRLDLVYGSAYSDSVYYALRNAANTGYETPVQRPSTGHKDTVGVADFTGDGQPDIVATNDNLPSFDLWVQKDDGTFTPAPDSPFNVGGRAIGMAVADFNGDRRPDVAVGDYSNDTVDVFLGQGGGGFSLERSYPSGDGPAGVEAGDFNFDGRPDLAIANQAGLRVTVLLRTPGGFVADPSSPIVTNQAATGIAIADFDADKRQDLAVANLTSSTLSVLLNRTPFPTPPPVDLDGDDDGVQRPADCDDANPAVRPGAKDKPGDGIDQDCRGGDAAYPRLRRTVAYKLGYGDAFTVFSVLEVRPARKGDRIGFSCKGKGCKRKKAKVKVRKNGPGVSLTRYVKDAQLKPGTRIELRITRRDSVGSFRRFTIRSGKLPKQTRRCLPPGATKPARC